MTMGDTPPLIVPGVLVVDEVGSTNTDLMQRVATGAIATEALPLWLMARRQTAGRGRQGRPWVSSEGNLMASLALRLNATPDVTHQLSFVAGLAVCMAVRDFISDTTGKGRLKWPNDVLVDGAKISGILCETTALPHGAGRVAVLGIGINVASHPDDMHRPTTSIAALTGEHNDPELVLEHLSTGLMAALSLWDHGRGFADIRRRWLALGHRRGEPLTVHINTPNEAGTGPMTGRFAGLDADGALLLERAHGDVLRITFGDVTPA
jgi:BirA family transcriptional regulator, biotin operon repressor / biotin---[acetyl-CoA-carboxylase] ligase